MPVIISVVVTTYNWPQSLKAVLESLIGQLDRHFEVIIADGGSKQETRDLVAAYGARAPFPIRHSWQEDKGFRLSRSRNQAVSLSEGDYLVFIDGDCCLLADFMTSHRRLMEKGWFISGKRCFLKKGFSEKILSQQIAHYRWSRKRWFFRSLCGACNRPFQFLNLPVSTSWRKNIPRQWEGSQTCNLGVWKEDFLAVNGFDMDYQTYGLEDSDFIIRLMRAGIYRKRADYTSPVLHFYHRRLSTDQNRHNRRQFEALLADESRIMPVSGYSECP